MRLIIDDCPRRIRRFQEAFGNVRTASTFEAAIRMLMTHPDGDFTEIYLDHDGVEGEEIARFLVACDTHRSAAIFIHSSNYAGACQMFRTLSEAGYHDVRLVDFADVVG